MHGSSILALTKRLIAAVFFSLAVVTVVRPLSAEPWPQNNQPQWNNNNTAPQQWNNDNQAQNQWTNGNQTQNQWTNGNQTQTAQPQNQWTADAQPAGGEQNWQNAAVSDRTIVSVSNDVQVYGAKRLGINIGSYDQYGAAQYLRNLIPNPGFEPAEMAMMFLAAPGATANRVQPNGWNGLWNGHPSGFWDGAQFEIIGGAARGQFGTVQRFSNDGGRYSFYLQGNRIAPQHRDVIIVRQQIDGYYTETPTRFHTADPTEKRPGSPGVQALRIQPSAYDPGFAVPFDSFARDADSTAGKLHIIEGLWKFELWVKPSQPGQSVEIKFLRHREVIFFNETFNLQPGWQKIERSFFVAPGTDPLIPFDVNPLGFEVRIASNDAPIWIDDSELSRIDNRYSTAFSDNFVELLRELRPGVLRDWGHQLGTSLDNQIAEPWARRTNDFDPRDSVPVKYHYSLHEFLELSRAVGAEPWYVIPPTWSAGELQNLIAYLSAPAGSHPYANKRAALGQSAPWTSVFPQIHLEFGNEMWGGNTIGDPFAGATLWDGYHVGEIVGERLQLMRRSPYFQANKLDLIIGGQAGFPGRQMEIQSRSTAHDTIAVAPYFSNNITSYGSDYQLYLPSFATAVERVDDAGKMAESVKFAQANGRDTDIAIYEINSHLTHGSMATAARNEFLTGMNMGLALPLHMLTYQAELGVRNQAAFTALQYSWEMPGKYGERARLWGLLRDSEATGRKRPAWLGMEIINRAIRGDIITTEQSGLNPSWQQQPLNGLRRQVEVPYIHSFAFKSNTGGAIVLFNLDLYSAQTVELQLPYAPGAVRIHTLLGDHVGADNEDAENVRIVTETRHYGQSGRLQLPKHSITVIEWGN